MKTPRPLIIPGIPQIDTTPPPPVTNYSHPRCYARAFRDCSNTISNEHYISEQVLALWTVDGLISTNMYSTLPGKLIHLKPNSLGSNILCDRHNAALSGLDDIGGEFCHFIKNIPPQTSKSVINGCDLERCLLKLFLGYSVLYYKQERGIKNWEPSLALLETLFMKRPFEKECGLYAFSIKNIRGSISGLGINYVIDNATNDGVGIIFTIEGIVMFFGVVPPQPINPNPHMQLHYHPAILAVTEDLVTRELHTGWLTDLKITQSKDLYK